MARYQLDQDRLHARAPQAIVMHPGPMIRGLEITSEVADGPQSVIAEQVRNGVAIRMALIHRALMPELPPLAAVRASRPLKSPAKATKSLKQETPKKRGGS
jgi:hypothetical protein